MFCKNCGVALAGDVKFCPECGTPIDDIPTPPGKSTAAQSAWPPPDQQPITQIVRPTPENSGNTNATAPAAGPAKRVNPWFETQFAKIANGEKPNFSLLSCYYGFLQQLYHKSYGLFAKTFLPMMLAFLVDAALLCATLPTQSDGPLANFALLLLLICAIWATAISIWNGKNYAKALYRQTGGKVQNIPQGLLAPVLVIVGYIVALILVVVVSFALAQPDTGMTAEAAVQLEPTARPTVLAESEEEKTVVAQSTPVPTTAPTVSPEPTTAPQTEIQEADYILTYADEPWVGAWYSENEGYVVNWAALVAFGPTQDVYETPFGEEVITLTDARDESYCEKYVLSADRTTLRKEDADNNVTDTFTRPDLSIAETPLPVETWGAYQQTEGTGCYSAETPMLVDAFRIGDITYTELQQNDNGTYSASFSQAPDQYYQTFAFVEENGTMTLTFYNDDGNITDVFERVE